jgi:hypothetical protein
MVIIAVDHVLPIDRSYWLAADDIVLLGSHGATARQQHATALVSRQLDHRQAPRLWTIPKQSTSWLWPSRGPTLIHYRTDLSLTARELPAVHWTECRNSSGLRNGSLADKRLIRQARAIAENLCRPNAWQTAPANGECAASMKKIQLSTLCASIQREPGIVRA